MYKRGDCTISLLRLTPKFYHMFPQSQCPAVSVCAELAAMYDINTLSKKLYLSDLKTHFVPRSKHSLLRSKT